MRLAYLVSHPIQYQAPLFRSIAALPGIDFEVLFCHDHGVRATLDPGFGREIRFDVALTEGFPHRFLRNVSPRPSPTFLGNLNPEVISLIGRPRHDAIVLHGYGRATNLAAVLLPRGRRPKLLLRGDSNSRTPVARGKAMAKALVLPQLLKRIDGFLSIGTRNTEYYLRYGVPQSRITVAPYAVDNAYFATRAAEARACPDAVRRQLGLPVRVPLFVFCGKLIGLKRVQDAIRALAAVRKRSPCAMAIAGDGPLRAELERLVGELSLQSQVHFLGFRNQSELPALYGASDVLVLPSEREAWGLVVNEAMACGLAVLASEEVGCAPDLVGEDNGAVFRAGDVESLARAMGSLAGDSRRLQEAKSSSLTKIQGWSIEASAARVVEGARQALAA